MFSKISLFKPVYNGAEQMQQSFSFVGNKPLTFTGTIMIYQNAWDRR